jgi:hypothetical protein
MPTNLTDFADLSDSQKMVVLSIGLQNAQNKLSEYDRLLVTGDGNILPIAERMRNVEGFVSSVRYWLRFVAGAIVLQTITFGAAAIVYFIKLYPLLEKLSEQP